MSDYRKDRSMSKTIKSQENNKTLAPERVESDRRIHGAASEVARTAVRGSVVVDDDGRKWRKINLDEEPLTREEDRLQRETRQHDESIDRRVWKITKGTGLNDPNASTLPRDFVGVKGVRKGEADVARETVESLVRAEVGDRVSIAKNNRRNVTRVTGYYEIPEFLIDDNDEIILDKEDFSDVVIRAKYS